MENFLIGRQQILDQNLNTVAYEILFRGANFDASQHNEAYSATRQVITDTLLEIGLQNITGNTKAFINFTEQHLLDKTPLILPKEHIVIEVLENVSVTPQLVNILSDFSKSGFTIALDDFVLTPEWEPLLEIADIIKLDILQMPMEQTLELIDQLKPYDLTLLAEKVETREDYNQLKDAGCELFQGYFFNKPETIRSKRQNINKHTLLELLSAVNQADISFTDLGHIIGQDPHLTVKLLNYINSAFFSLPNPVDSIPHAISLLGMTELKRWINILTLASVTDKPVAILQNLLIRAKMCELFAEKTSLDCDELFLIGLLSGIDGLLDRPLPEILAQLPLDQIVTNAILNKAGKAGKILNLVLNYEKWDIHSVEWDNYSANEITHFYLQSIEWSNQVLNHAH
jgi:EAL and modified HD-GYP domain-containing signal transduction protein